MSTYKALHDLISTLKDTGITESKTIVALTGEEIQSIRSAVAAGFVAMRNADARHRNTPPQEYNIPALRAVVHVASEEVDWRVLLSCGHVVKVHKARWALAPVRGKMIKCWTCKYQS